MVLGGSSSAGDVLATVELYAASHAASSVIATAGTPRRSHAAVRLAGDVLACAGQPAATSGLGLQTCDLLRVSTQEVMPGPSLAGPRQLGAMTDLAGGTGALFIGGYSASSVGTNVTDAAQVFACGA